MMKHNIFICCLLIFLGCGKEIKETSQFFSYESTVKYPVITIDPNIKVFSEGNNINTEHLKHPDGRTMPLFGMLRVDGQVYRFLGSESLPDKSFAPMASDKQWQGSYSFTRPDKKWVNWDYDDLSWSIGMAPFGSRGMAEVNTVWPSHSIWVRRSIEVDPATTTGKGYYLKYSHDDVCEIFVNGIRLVNTGFEWRNNVIINIPEDVVKTFDKGKIIIAAHCQNLEGDAFLDFGIYEHANQYQIKDWEGKYTFEQPEDGWESKGLVDKNWNTGKAPFGSFIDYECNVNWTTPDLWIRRQISVDRDFLVRNLILEYSFDDVLDLYINGVQVVENDHDWGFNKRIVIPEEIKQTAEDGVFTIAAHCRNKDGGAYFNFSIYPDDVAEVVDVKVSPTQTIYSFKCGAVDLDVNFAAPAILNDLDLLLSPVNYIAYEVSSNDGQEHDIEIYFDASPRWANGNISNSVCELSYHNNVAIAKTGRKEQTIFQPVNEYMKINWGYFCLAADNTATIGEGNPRNIRRSFAVDGTINSASEIDDLEHIAVSKSLGRTRHARDFIMVGYDDVYSVKYFGDNLRPYWNRSADQNVEYVFANAKTDFKKTLRKCDDYDKELLSVAKDKYGYKYSSQLPLWYRNVVSSFKVVEGRNQNLLLFPEGRMVNKSTVSDLLLLIEPDFIKAMLEPMFEYCESGKWLKPYAPDNLGCYPFIGGQFDRNSDPISETANMLLYIASLTRKDGNNSYARQHWDTITKWYEYLISEREKDNKRYYDISSHIPSPPLNRTVAISAGISAYEAIEK